MKTTKLLHSLQRAWRPRPLVWALALAGVATHALVPGAGEARAAGALPTGLNVVHGQATVVQAGNQMTVTNSAGAVLNWQTFSIGAPNLVRFEQPNASSRVLNRVVGNDPSSIFGQLSSNGQVWLINPNGVLFGRGSRVDVGSLVVSTLNIGNDDWRAGRYTLTGGADNHASIVNQGELLTSTGGRVLLVAGSGGVRNEGVITAPDGQVSLAAGASVELVDGETRNVAVRVQAPQGEVLNLGSMSVGGGRVDLAAAMVNQQGFVRAESLSGSGGQIVLSGSEGVNLAAGSITSAAGASGGSVQVDGGHGTTLLAGEVNVTGSGGKGGDALLLGRQVGLLAGSVVDASGAAGGGRVRIGGGLQGQDSSVVNARAVYMDQGAQIKADATQRGDGGTVVLWSNEATRAYGSLNARGGAQGGDGGFIETSGGWLDAQPASIRTDAAFGKAGMWLLDPNNITISNSTFNSNITGAPNFTSTGDSAILMASSINAALAQGNNVTVTTGNGGTSTQLGDIFVNGVTLSSSAQILTPVSLTLTAAHDIRVSNSTFQSQGAPLNVTLSAGNGTSGTGAIAIFDSRILTGGGNIVLGGPTRAVGPNITSPRAGAVGVGGVQSDAIGVSIIGSTLNAGSGNVTVVGQAIGGQLDREATGVLIADIPDDGDGGGRVTSITGRDIDIYGWADSNASRARHGVHITGDLTTITATHSLNVTGVANSASFNVGEGGWEPIGVFMDSGRIGVRPAAADTTASLTIHGTVNDAQPGTQQGINRHVGVQVTGNALLEATNRAQVQITGVDQMNSPQWSAAVMLSGNSSYNFSNAGPVRIEGDTRVFLGLTPEEFATGASTTIFDVPTIQSFTVAAGDLLNLRNVRIGGGPSTLTLTGRDISLLNTDIAVGASLVTGVNLDATRNIRLERSTITPSDSMINISLNAASGNSGSGAIEITNGSFLFSGGGDITIGGGSTAVGPNITAPRAGAVATDGTREAGVLIVDSSINANEGTVRISGQSVAPDGRSAIGVLITGSDGASDIQGGNIDIFGWVDSNAPFARTGVHMDGGSTVIASNSLTITGVANSTVFNLGSNVAPIGVHITGGIVGIAAPFGGGGGGVRPEGQQWALGVAPQVPPMALTITGTTNDAAITDPETARTRYGVLIDGDATITAGYFFDRPATGSAAGRIRITEPLPFDQPTVTITGTDQSVNGAVSVRIDTPNADFTDATSLTIAGNRQIELTGRMIAPFQGTADVHAGTTLSMLQFDMEGGPTTAMLQGDTLLRASGNINFEALTQITLRSREVHLGYGAGANVVTGGSIRVFTDRYFTEQPSLLSAAGTGTAITIAGYDQQSGITSLQSTTAPATMTTDNGRWLIYAVDDTVPTAGLGNFSFHQYNTTYPTALTGTNVATGNGMVYQQAPVLTLNSTNTITKPYDGTTALGGNTGNLNLSVSGFRPGHVLDEDAVTATLAYAAPGVVSNALLNIVNSTLPGIVDAADRPVYGYTLQSGVRGSITPRTLVYDAQPVTLNAAQLPGFAFTGTVIGFIAGETVGNATTGTLTFTTPATPQSPPGRHPIQGSGLTAANYTFSQGEGNDTALTLLVPPPIRLAPLPEGIPEIEDSTRLYRQALPPLPRGPEGVRALDALQSLRVDPTWLSMAFGELDLSSMSREEIAALLEARRQYKMQILAVGRERLTQDPSLADVPACQTARQAETGRCLVSAELLAAIDAGGETASINAPGPSAEVPSVAAVVAAGQQPPRPAAPPATPAAAAARPPAPAEPALVVPVPALPMAQAPTAAPLSTPVVGTVMPAPRPVEPRTPPRVRQAAQPVLQPPPIPSARAVQSASIPQIQRKIAVLVGIDNYVDERIPSLENARRDVDAVARVLEQRLGYETLIVRDAGREAMVGLLNRLALQVRPQDSVVVYYAGHGTVIDGTNQGYWIPATADAERPETWISNRDIGRLLGSLRAQQVVLISDSCFSGSLVGDKRIQAGSTTDARLMLQRRATVVMSSGGDEPVADGATGGHSPFSNSLMATLQGLDNWRVGGNVFDKVRDDVTKRLPQTPRYGPARDARHAEGADYLFEQRQLGQR